MAANTAVPTSPVVPRGLAPEIRNGQPAIAPSGVTPLMALFPIAAARLCTRLATSRFSCFPRIVLALSLGLCVAPLYAQPAADALGDAEFPSVGGPPAKAREGRARFFDSADGQFDLSYFLQTARGFLPVPLLVTEPAVGYGGGGIGMFVRPREEAGTEGWVRPDMSGIGGVLTENGTGRCRSLDAGAITGRRPSSASNEDQLVSVLCDAVAEAAARRSCCR